MTPGDRAKRQLETRTNTTFREYVHKTLEDQNRVQENLVKIVERTSLTLHGESGQNGLASDVRELKRRDEARKWLERTVLVALIGVSVLALVAGLRYLVIVTK